MKTGCLGDSNNGNAVYLMGEIQRQHGLVT